ncbi:unnamed protein product [Sphagnum jensenii]|uniref:Transmembrane protein n=1 Tax=Sphagnum jensenii TaxID=128206 RepID=A0ABP1BP60_9BRYO
MRKCSPSQWTGPATGPDKDLLRSHRPYPSLQSSGSFLARCVSTFSNKVAISASDRFSYVSVCSDKKISKPMKRRVPGFIHPSRLSLVRLFSRRLWSLAPVAFLPSPLVLALVSSICTQFFYRLSMCV